MNKINKLALTCSLLLSVTIGKAQDLFQTFSDNNQAMTNAILTSHVNSLVIAGMYKNGNAGKAGRGYTYHPNPQVKKEVITRMLSKMGTLSSSDAAALRQFDFDKIFSGLVAPYGLKYDDAADILTAYQVLNWIIINQATDPKPASVAAYRAVIGDNLYKNKTIYNDPYERAKFGEELKMLFVIQHAPWQNAIKKGTLKAYSETIAQQYIKQFHQDLRGVKLDSRGMHL